jgi:hypothetical protein
MSREIQRRAKLQEEQTPYWDENYDIEEFIDLQDCILEGVFDSPMEADGDLFEYSNK